MDTNTYCTDVHDALSICARCGYCRDACPAYAASGWESYSPRGKFTILDSLAEGKDFPGTLANRVFQCTLCGACREACITGLDPRGMWVKLRKQLADRGQAPPVMEALGEMIMTKGNMAGEDKANRLLWTENVENVPEDTAGKKDAEVLYFIGCMASLYPAAYAVAQSSASMFLKAKVDFATMGADEICCGFPLVAGGLTGKLAEVAAANVRKIEELRPGRIVSTCPGCVHMWQHEYPSLLGKPVPVPVQHSSQYLLELAKEGRLRFKSFDKVVTYHDPCDLGRNNGIYEEPRELLRCVPGLQLVEMEKNREQALCCGGGGNLEMSDKDLSERIGTMKMAMIKRTGAQVVVTGCQQCRRTIQAAARREKARVRVMEITEFLLSVIDDGEG